MNCKFCQDAFWEMISADGLPPSQYVAHLKDCGECRASYQDFQKTWGILDNWISEPPPPRLYNRLLQQAEMPTTFFGKIRAQFDLLKFAGALLAAILATIISVRILFPDQFGSPENLLMNWRTALPILLWVPLYTGAFYLLSLRHRRAFRLQAMMSANGLTALAIFMLMTLFKPIPVYVNETCGFSTPADMVAYVSRALYFFIFGLTYAFVPMMLATLSIGRDLSKQSQALHRRAGGSNTTTLANGLIFLLILSPAIGLQCHCLAAGIFAGWLGGAAIGALGGSWCSFRLRGIFAAE